jgi:hypothetical protein
VNRDRRRVIGECIMHGEAMEQGEAGIEDIVLS